RRRAGILAQQTNCQHFSTGNVRAPYAQWSRGHRISRARHRQTGRWITQAAVQHPLRSTYLRAHAHGCLRLHRRACLLHAGGALAMFWNKLRRRQPQSPFPKEAVRGSVLAPETRLPLDPKFTPGYYPNFHTLDQQDYWDNATRRLILDRVRNVPSIRFFTAEEALTM